jgi:hypothetical protein
MSIPPLFLLFVRHRIAEKEGRDDAVKQFKEMLGMCRKGVTTFSNITFNMSSVDSLLYNSSLANLSSLCNETTAWFNLKRKAQDKKALNEDPVLTVRWFTQG